MGYRTTSRPDYQGGVAARPGQLAFHPGRLRPQRLIPPTKQAPLPANLPAVLPPNVPLNLDTQGLLQSSWPEN